MSAREHDDLADDDAEIVDALPMAVGEDRRDPPPAAVVREPVVAPSRPLPVAQAAAVAVSGFAAGAVAAAALHGVTRRRAVKAATRRTAKSRLPVLGTRSFLVDVHLLGEKD